MIVGAIFGGVINSFLVEISLAPYLLSQAVLRNSDVGEAARADGPGLTFDISVPIPRIGEFIERGIAEVRAILPDIRPYPLGHIGDGNLHFSFKWPTGMPIETARTYEDRVKSTVYELVTKMAGSISAEHGIGTEKMKDLIVFKSQSELKLMCAIKTALDPRQIMNPGKIIEGEQLALSCEAAAKLETAVLCRPAENGMK